MSDLAATNCGGCTQTTTSGGCNCMWIILILLFCGGWNNNDGCGCGGGNGFFKTDLKLTLRRRNKRWYVLF